MTTMLDFFLSVSNFLFLLKVVSSIIIVENNSFTTIMPSFNYFFAMKSVMHLVCAKQKKREIIIKRVSELISQDKMMFRNIFAARLNLHSLDCKKQKVN